MSEYEFQKSDVNAAGYYDRLVKSGLAESRKMSVRIGRGGRKLHPATVLVCANGCMILQSINCACRGTASGRANNSARIVNAEPNCGTRSR